MNYNKFYRRFVYVTGLMFLIIFIASLTHSLFTEAVKTFIQLVWFGVRVATIVVLSSIVWVAIKVFITDIKG